MSDIQLDYSIYVPIVVIILTLFITLTYAIIPTESTEENRPLLYALSIINLLFSVTLLFLLYLYNRAIKGNIIHISLIFTFLIALPITLYNIGVTSLLYSNT
jgi:hypothetical protein